MLNPLLAIAKEYTSEADFKKRNLPKYLLAKKQRLLAKAFPPKAEEENDIKGIYYLYKDLKVVYIGHSINCLQAIKDLKETTTFHFNNYRLYTVSSDSDRLVLSLYLSNYYRPRHNTNIGKNGISFKIDSISKILGPSIKGTL